MHKETQRKMEFNKDTAFRVRGHDVPKDKLDTWRKNIIEGPATLGKFEFSTTFSFLAVILNGTNRYTSGNQLLHAAVFT